MGSERGIGEIFPIDIHAPRGIFETTDGDIYLVCDSVEARLAIALKHSTHEPFMIIYLDHIAVDYGAWLGVGKFCLVEESDEKAGYNSGNLHVEQNVLHICAFGMDGWAHRPTIAHGWCSAIHPVYAAWALTTGDRIVFQHDGTGKYNSAELAAKVSQIM